MQDQRINKLAEGLINYSCSLKKGEKVFAKGLCLPSDIKMTEEEQDFVIEVIKSCF